MAAFRKVSLSVAERLRELAETAKDDERYHPYFDGAQKESPMLRVSIGNIRRRLVGLARELERTAERCT